ncbi:MAG: cob(I)yrinic acid a,c-diamide adenosyltransferase [Bacteroidetes bacterium]|nr:cob(I)yrinic acid a,c-diamide adenosyltransferase [Bacteroidota bacterium]
MAQKIYSKTGDNGDTSLFGGSRVPKYDIRIETLGAIDEFNAFIGIVISFHPPEKIGEILKQIQSDLFIASAELSSKEPNSKIPRLQEHQILALEKFIDSIDTLLPPLSSFIIPGGSIIAAHLHAARSICRRAERTLSLLASKESLNPLLLIYFNRCSDLLFVLARYANKIAKMPESEWHPSNDAHS